jgi:hypothetical protein
VRRPRTGRPLRHRQGHGPEPSGQGLNCALRHDVHHQGAQGAGEGQEEGQGGSPQEGTLVRGF